MKKILLPFTFLLLLIQASCVTSDRETGTANADRVYSPRAESDRSRLNSRTVLRTVQAQHEFSDRKAKDRFVLLLQGPRIIDANARFLIISAAGDTLRNEVMPARVLIDEQALQVNPQASSVRAQELAILMGMNRFFTQDKFTSPAIPKGITAPPAETDPEGWQAVQADNRAVGFDYVDASGKEKRISYAKKLNKAVIVAD